MQQSREKQKIFNRPDAVITYGVAGVLYSQNLQRMTIMKLKDIKSPRDIKNLTVDELKSIAAEMRQAVLGRCAAVSGHVSPNLGDIEAVIALHYVFDAPVDSIVFDVSHQDFAHKMLTGRVNGFIDPACYGSIGEYTDPTESPEYDIFYAGHTSPAISLCVGLAKARQLRGDRHDIVAFVGDGSLSGGEAFEGLDAGAALGQGLIVVINDNQMAIAENHGGIYDNLRQLRETNGTSDNNIFKAFGYDYVYMRNGNDISSLIEAFKSVKGTSRPVVVHINTQKGLGYVPAERDREAFHWSVPFDIASGLPLNNSDAPDNDTILRDFIMGKAAADSRLLVISSATPDSFGLGPDERRLLGDRYIDVAIAEQTGVSVMAGAARGGVKVIYPVVATFLQRAYDQLLEDWAMDHSPALMPVTATGVRGIPDMTHLGFWDIPMITSIPDIVYLAPANAEELKAMLDWGIAQDKYKVAVRVPTYSYEHADYDVDTDYSDLNRFKMLKRGSRVAVIGVGDFLVKGRQFVSALAGAGIDATLINPRFVSGVDREMLASLKDGHSVVVTIEDGSLEGGFGQRVASALGDTDLKVLNFGLAKKFVDRYDVARLESDNSLDIDTMLARVLAIV